jgi:hypothetical protein
LASRKRRRLSAWKILARLGHKGDDQDEIVQHVFDTTARLTLRGDDGEPLDGDDFLVEVFERLGSSTDWPAVGGLDWNRLRFQALTEVVRRLGREGLLDCVSVGSERTPAPDADTGKLTDGEPDCGGSDGTDARASNSESDVAPRETGDEGSDAVDGNVDGDMPKSAEDDDPDPRVGVQAYRAMLRRGQRNPTGWFRMVNRATPYRVIAGWASETCPSIFREKLTALLDDLNAVKFWDDDGHVRGAEILSVLESELEEGCGHERWMCVVSDFEDAIRRLRTVFEKLSLL